MLGFAAGVMIAASFWSLLAPSIEMAEAQGLPRWLPAVTGFLAGGVVLRLFDSVLPHLHLFGERWEAEGLPTGWDRSVLLVVHRWPHVRRRERRRKDVRKDAGANVAVVSCPGSGGVCDARVFPARHSVSAASGLVAHGCKNDP